MSLRSVRPREVKTPPISFPDWMVRGYRYPQAGPNRRTGQQAAIIAVKPEAYREEGVTFWLEGIGLMLQGAITPTR